MKISLIKLLNQFIENLDCKRSEEKKDLKAYCWNSNYKYFSDYATSEAYNYVLIFLINKDIIVKINISINYVISTIKSNRTSRWICEKYNYYFWNFTSF